MSFEDGGRDRGTSHNLSSETLGPPVVLGSLVFVLTTDPARLMSALTQVGMSPKIAYVISASLQIIPAFQARAQSILLAQQARGLAIVGSPLKRARALLPLLGPLILGMITDVDERSTAMEARAFGATPKPTSLIIVPDPVGERVARWLMFLSAITVVVLVVVGVIA